MGTFGASVRCFTKQPPHCPKNNLQMQLAKYMKTKPDTQFTVASALFLCGDSEFFWNRANLQMRHQFSVVVSYSLKELYRVYKIEEKPCNLFLSDFPLKFKIFPLLRAMSHKFMFFILFLDRLTL